MTSIHTHDTDLHHPDGTHRSTSPSTSGADLERHEHRIGAHLAEHRAVDVHVVRIDPDGTVTHLPGTDILAVGRDLFDNITTTFTCQPIHGPEVPDTFPSFGYPIVGVCHDFAYSVTPTVNPKAWALYGRSPIAGPALIARVDHHPFPAEFLTLLSTDFVREPNMRLAAMVRIALDHGLVWPS